MKKFSIKCTGSNVEEAMEQISQLSDLDLRQKNCLTLLTEELFSMMDTVLKNKEATFAIARENNTWTLTMTVETFVSPQAREEFLSLSSTGKNIAHKGIKGILSAFVDYIAQGEALTMPVPSSMTADAMDYVQMWQLSQYMNQLSEAEKKDAWDGLEKSIIANFADDIMVGVTDNKVKVIVTKSF